MVLCPRVAPGLPFSFVIALAIQLRAGNRARLSTLAILLSYLLKPKTILIKVNKYPPLAVFVKCEFGVTAYAAGLLSNARNSARACLFRPISGLVFQRENLRRRGHL